MKLPRGAKLLTSPREVAAVASPLRIEILEHLLLAGPSSVSDLAALMGRPATALHYHLKLLNDAGIVRVAGTRRARTRAESLYRIAAPGFAVAGKHNDKSATAAALHTLGATLRLSQREAARALRAGAVRSEGAGRSFHSRRLRAPLSAAALRRVNGLLGELEATFTRAMKGHIRNRPARPDDVVSLTFLLTPAGRRKKP